MSLLVLLIILVLVVVAVGILLRVLTGVAKLIVSLVVLVLLVGGVAYVSIDFYNVDKNFYAQDKLFLLDINGEVAGAFVLGSTMIPRPLDDLESVRAAYSDLAAVQENYYKVLVLTWPFVAGDLDLQDINVTGAEVKAALVSDNPKQLYVDKAVKKHGDASLGHFKLQADTLYPTQDSFRSAMFTLLATKAMSEPSNVIKGIKRGTAVIAPETVTFKILKLLPDVLIDVLFPAPT